MWFQSPTQAPFDHNIMSSTCLQQKEKKSRTSDSSVFVGILVSGLLAALAIVVGYFKCQRRTGTKGLTMVSTFSTKNVSTVSYTALYVATADLFYPPWFTHSCRLYRSCLSVGNHSAQSPLIRENLPFPQRTMQDVCLIMFAMNGIC